MELRKEEEDNDESSKETNWGMIFMLLINRGFSHEEILKLSYPQFCAYLSNINEPLTFNVTIPYLGSSKDKEKNKIEKATEFNTEGDLLKTVALMNAQFK